MPEINEPEYSCGDMLILSSRATANLQLSRGGNGNGGLGLAGTGSLLFDGLDNVHTLDNLAEDDVLAIEPAGRDSGEEELGAVAGSVLAAFKDLGR